MYEAFPLLHICLLVCLRVPSRLYAGISPEPNSTILLCC